MGVPLKDIYFSFMYVNQENFPFGRCIAQFSSTTIIIQEADQKSHVVRAPLAYDYSLA